MPRQTLSPLEAPATSPGARPSQSLAATPSRELLSPRLREFLLKQQFLVSIGVLIYLVLLALRVRMQLLSVIVMSICVGNILSAIMESSKRLYHGLKSPWNWIVYVTLLTAISLLGALIIAAIILATGSIGDTYPTVLRMTAPFSIVVSMTVGTVWYAVVLIQLRLQEHNQKLQAALDSETVALQKQEQELLRARKIQQDLLPKSIPQLRGLQVSGAWQPASTVSGGYYDVMALDEHRLAICIGDVVGKGITAALLMANLQAAFRAFATSDASPAAVCSKLNAFMCGNVANGKFISFFYCIADVRNRSLDYEDAGHCPAQLVRRSGETVTLSGDGAVLGVLPDWTYKDNCLRLESGDRIVLFTDGVTEAEDARGDEFGEQRVTQALQATLGSTAEDIRSNLMAEVTGFCSGQFRDDATVVVLAVQ